MRPFKFENMWLKYEGFQGSLKEWWNGIYVHGSASFVISSKLIILKSLIKDWNSNMFGRVETNKNLALRKLKGYRSNWKRNECCQCKKEGQRRRHKICMRIGSY